MPKNEHVIISGILVWVWVCFICLEEEGEDPKVS